MKNKVSKLLLLVLVFFLCLLILVEKYKDSNAIYRNVLNTKVYLSVLDSANSYLVRFDSQGGTPTPPSRNKLLNDEVGSLPNNVTKEGYNFIGWWTMPDGQGGTKISPSTTVTGDVTYYAHWVKIVCKKAASGTLHTETCSTKGGCLKHDYTTSGDTSIITYGQIPTADSPIVGDAYDCDVNNNGQYDYLTERFYYVRENTSDGDTAVLVHYTSFDEYGQMDSSASREIYTYDAGKAYLPDSTLWSNPALIAFDGKVSRYIAHEDLAASCGSPVQYNSSAYLSTCQFFLENSKYQANASGRSGIWLEPLNNTPYRIQTSSVEVQVPTNNPSSNAVRPVIEIPYNSIDGYKERTLYRVIFNAKGGSGGTTYERYEGQTIGTFPTTTRPGYTFLGWFTDDGTFLNRVTEQTVVNGELRLYAAWSQDVMQYVFYIPGSCTFRGSNNNIISSNNDCISTINPTGNSIDYTATANKYIDTGVSLYSTTNIGKDYEIGFTIDDYTASSNVSRATLVSTKKEETYYPGMVFRRDESTSNFILQARTTQAANEQLTFDSTTTTSVVIARRGGSIYYSINGGQEIFLTTPEFNPTFDLTTWFGAGPKNATGTTMQRYLVGTLSNMYIKLEADGVSESTITFHGEGGTPEYNEKTIISGTQIGSLPNATRSGYAFDGWYTQNGTKVTTSTTINQDIDLYAHWKDIYLVTFYGEGGTVSISPNTIEVADGESIGSTTLAGITASKSGYRFDGWYTQSGTQIDGTEVISQDEDYYAHYKQLFTVTFNGEGGTVSINPNTMDVADGESIGSTNLPTASKPNLVFIGWYTTASGQGTLIDGTEAITQTTEYHARYAASCKVTFDAGENGTPYFSSKDVAVGSAIGELPTAENTNIMLELEGWYLDVNDATTKADEVNTIITSNVTYHAKWVTTTKTAIIGNTRYDTLAEAVAAVPTTGVKTTITMLKNTAEKVTIDGGRNVYLDLNGKTVSHPSGGQNEQVFTLGGTSAGTLELVNGTVSSNRASGMINVNSMGTLIVNTGAVLTMTSTRQAIYVNGGTLYIYDGTISNKQDRGAVQVLGNGSATITGGTITSTNSFGIHLEVGTLTIGTKDGTVDATKPVIQGKNYGIAAYSTFNFYDGIIKGQTAPIGIAAATGNNPTVTVDTGETKIADYETGTDKVNDNESGTSYKVFYLEYQSNTYRVTLDLNGGTLTPAVSAISVTPGDKIGTIPTPTRGAYIFNGWYDDATDLPVDANTIPQGDMTIYADWSFTPSHTTFDLMNTAMRTYYTNISTWKNNENTFQSNMDTNFNNNGCLECDSSMPKPYQSCPATGENQCDRPSGFSTGVTGTINVYLAVPTVNQQQTTWSKGTQVSYVTATNDGILYDMIPGQTYYWELDSDNNIYGTVTVTGERRILEGGGIRNIRDIGGFEVDTDGNGTADGVVNYGRMFRGPKLNTSDDVASLLKLGVTEEVDLRGSNNDPKITTNYQPREITNYEIDPEHYSTNYANLRDALSDTMDDIIGGENVYFHCAIGTDRTGTLAWFLEGLLGVSEEDRVQDYELSYFYGLLNRHRFYSEQPGSSITHRFVYMHNLYSTNTDIYNYYTVNGTDTTAVNKVTAFRNAVITSYNQP